VAVEPGEIELVGVGLVGVPVLVRVAALAEAVVPCSLILVHCLVDFLGAFCPPRHLKLIYNPVASAEAS
jgi:hypothetical protein